MNLMVARIVSVLLLATSMATAQTPESSQVRDKKAQAEKEKKALALAEVMIKEIQSLRLPENRIRIGIGLADTLWPRDQKRALALFKEAVKALDEFTAALANEEEDTSTLEHLPRMLRQEIVQVAAKYDARLAADFVRATRIDSRSRPPNSGLTNYEANLEMRVAIQIAEKDPAEALAIAEDSLKISIDYESLSLLNALHSKDKKLAERFLDSIIKSIRTFGIGNSAATPIALNLIRTWSENVRAANDPAAPRTTTSLLLSNLNEETARELTNLIADSLLSDGTVNTTTAFGRTFIDGPSSMYPGMIQGIVQQLKPILSDFEKLAADRMPALRTRIAEHEKTYEAQQGPWVKYQKLGETGTADELMEAAKTAPIEMAGVLLNQASWKAINEDDYERARQFIDQNPNASQRTEMRRNLVRRQIQRAIEKKDIAGARALLPGLPIEEQVAMLSQLAASTALEGDKVGALKLLGEAQALLSNRARNYGQLQALINIASAYADVESSVSVSLVERVIDQVNELVAAAMVLDGFDVQGTFREGEFVIASGNMLNNLSQECGRILSSNARADANQAASTAERFQRPEMRLIALLQIVHTLLMRDE